MKPFCNSQYCRRFYSILLAILASLFFLLFVIQISKAAPVKLQSPKATQLAGKNLPMKSTNPPPPLPKPMAISPSVVGTNKPTPRTNLLVEITCTAGNTYSLETTMSLTPKLPTNNTKTLFLTWHTRSNWMAFSNGPVTFSWNGINTTGMEGFMRCWEFTNTGGYVLMNLTTMKIQ